MTVVGLGGCAKSAEVREVAATEAPAEEASEETPNNESEASQVENTPPETVAPEAVETPVEASRPTVTAMAYTKPRLEITKRNYLANYLKASVLDDEDAKIWIKAADNRITDVKYKTQGCAASIACGSVLTEIVMGKTLDEAVMITKQDVLVALGGLPERKIHCSMLAIDALKDAIYDYLVKNNKPVPQELIDKHEQLKPQIQELQKKGYILI